MTLEATAESESKIAHCKGLTHTYYRSFAAGSYFLFSFFPPDQEEVAAGSVNGLYHTGNTLERL